MLAYVASHVLYARGKNPNDLCSPPLQAYLREEGNKEHIDDIRKDLHRQFPNHEMFQKMGGHG